MVGGILSDVWKPKERASEEASTRSASAGSAGSAGCADDGGDDGAPVLSPTPLQATRHRRGGGAGQEQKNGGSGGSGGSEVSKGQPLGWVLSCVNGEHWDGGPGGNLGSGSGGSGREVRTTPLLFVACFVVESGRNLPLQPPPPPPRTRRCDLLLAPRRRSMRTLYSRCLRLTFEEVDQGELLETI